MPTEVETNKGYKTCTITLVTPGQSDSVIKVYPAEHETEKIWLDNARGIERWEIIERLLNNFAERGTRVAKPARWHSSNKDMRTPDLKAEDIPLVRLDGATLPLPPAVEQYDPLKMAKPETELEKKVKGLESIVGSLATAVSALTTVAQKLESKSQTTTLETVVQPVITASTATSRVACPECGKDFKNSIGLRFHKGKFHKK